MSRRPPTPTLFPYTTLFRSGRPVTIAVGEHVRLPRNYRGRDVLWWMEASGVWSQRYDEIDDIERAHPCRGSCAARDRKSTRLNSSHVEISYAVFCLKKKKKK